MNLFRLVPLATVLASIVAWSGPARADTVACTEITTFPTTITTQGVYCLKKSWFTNVANAASIVIQANNVTLDCNGNSLRVSNPGNGHIGIRAISRQNITIRNCVLLGYVTAIDLSGSGHLVEDNMIQSARRVGIQTSGGPNVVRRNHVAKVGGESDTIYPRGIWVSGSTDVLDNTVAGVVPFAGSVHSGIGILSDNNPDGEISGNEVWGVLGDGIAGGVGISLFMSPSASVRDNDLFSDGGDGGRGVECVVGFQSAVTGNRIVGFDTPISQCRNQDNASIH